MVAVGTAVWRQLGIAVARMSWHGVVPVEFVEQQLLGLFRHHVLLVAMFRVGPGKGHVGNYGWNAGFTDVSLHIRIFGLLEYRWL